jgi:ketosteroid isomerase-like protein
VTDSGSTRDANIALASRLMDQFGRDMDGWYDQLHERCVVEFPFGPSVGMPARIEGKEACTALFELVCEAVRVQFSDIVISPLADPSELMLEYRGYSEPQGKVYDQTYICLQKFKDRKLILYKEYWDATVVRETFGDLNGMF